MIKGIGVDIVDISRIRALCDEHGERFLERVFTPGEIGFCRQFPHPVRHFSGRFAAKESVMKVLKTGWTGGISWQDIEIGSGPKSVPVVKLKGAARELADSAGIRHIHVSISHGEQSAVAYAIGESGE